MLKKIYLTFLSIMALTTFNLFAQQNKGEQQSPSAPNKQQQTPRMPDTSQPRNQQKSGTNSPTPAQGKLTPDQIGKIHADAVTALWSKRTNNFKVQLSQVAKHLNDNYNFKLTSEDLKKIYNNMEKSGFVDKKGMLTMNYKNISNFYSTASSNGYISKDLANQLLNLTKMVYSKELTNRKYVDIVNKLTPNGKNDEDLIAITQSMINTLSTRSLEGNNPEFFFHWWHIDTSAFHNHIIATWGTDSDGAVGAGISASLGSFDTPY